MSTHRLERIDFTRPSRFTAVCSCGWRSEPTLNAGLAGALWDRHVEQQPHSASGPARIVDVDVTVGEAARELYADLVPALKHLVRGDDPLGATDGIERMEAIAGTLGEREQRLARAVRREWTRLAEDSTSRQRATVVVGLVELGERAREHLARTQAITARHPR